MSIKITKQLSFFVCLIFLASCSREEPKGPVEYDFPKEVSFQNNVKTYNLSATGFTSKISDYINYKIAGYLQNGIYKQGSDKFKIIMDESNAKQVTLKWAEDANPYKVQQSYNEFFRYNLSTQTFEKLKDHLIEFVHYFNTNINKGDIHTFKWIPSGSLEVYVNEEKVGTINNKEFNQTLLSVWFGNKAVVNRDQLTDFLK